MKTITTELIPMLESGQFGIARNRLLDLLERPKPEQPRLEPNYSEMVVYVDPFAIQRKEPLKQAMKRMACAYLGVLAALRAAAVSAWVDSCRALAEDAISRPIFTRDILPVTVRLSDLVHFHVPGGHCTGQISGEMRVSCGDATAPGQSPRREGVTTTLLRELVGPLPEGTAQAPASAESYEPAEFAWSKPRHRIRLAAKEFSEETHADYSAP
jgi:hypothetical protein